MWCFKYKGEKMKEIKYTIHTKNIERELITEFEATLKNNYDLFKGEEIHLMPDTHIGFIAPIGLTMTSKSQFISPELIGNDIGCGVLSVVLKGNKLNESDKEKLAKSIYKKMNSLPKKGIGSLGGGNHFIEIGELDNEYLITIHSGSRSIGASIYNECKLHCENYKKETIKQQKEDVIKSLKKQGKEKEIQKVINGFEPDLPKIEIAYLPKNYDKYNYLEEIKKGVKKAKENRETIMDHILNIVSDYGLVEKERVESIHNYIDFENETPIIRKGSISTNREKVVIPLNMRDGVLIGEPVNKEVFNISLPHGLGRKFSRTKAREEYDLDFLKEETKSIHSLSISEKIVDETPAAYKDVDIFLEDINKMLKNKKIYKTIINYKEQE